MKKFLFTSLFWLLLVPAAFAQQQISGTVTDDLSGEPLPGVNIRLDGSREAVMTDFNGGFSITATKSSVLSFSYIGYKTKKVTVADDKTLNVALTSESESLQEIVVTGYTKVRKTDLTSAQSTISAKGISETINTTVEQAIQGRAAGVLVTQNSGEPGGAISVNIRGISSLNGSNQPLYVIDGVQIAVQEFSGGRAISLSPLSGLNPADIETMNILQGPSATALYGSRGTNGVIVITTKRGKAGKVKIGYNYTYSLQAPPKNINVMNLRQYAQIVGEYHDIAGGKIPLEFLDPSILGDGTDWQKELYRLAPLTKHEMNISGGSENTTYYLSGEYFKQEGISQGSNFDRYAMRLNLDNKANDWLSLGANVSFNQTLNEQSASSESVIRNATRLSPNIPVKNFDGTYGGGSTDPTSPERYSAPNPIAMANLNTNETLNRQFLGGLNLKIDIIEGLAFKTSMNTNINYGSGTYFLPKYKFGVSERINSQLTKVENNSTYWKFDQFLNYDKSFGDHNVTAIFGHEAQSGAWKNLEGIRQDFPIDIIDLNVGDVKTSIANGGQNDWSLESYLGSASYNYKNKYFIQGAIRADGSSNFGPENKWGYFPSASAAWRVTEESFFDVKAISELKFRFETGVTGSNGPGGVIYGALNSGPTSWGTGFLPGKYANPNLKWEETTTNNIGINIGLFNNRITLEADYFDKQTDNLIMDLPLPLYYGVDGAGRMSPPTVNIGALSNKGWSIALNTINIKNSEFSWSTNFNISHFDAKIKKFYTKSAIVDRFNREFGEWTQRSVVGGTPWQFYGYIEEGLFQSLDEINNSALPVDNKGDELAVEKEKGIWVGDVKYRDISGPDGVPDGIIDERDQTFIGNPYPKLFGGMTNTFTYKGFTLGILLTGSYGNDVYNYSKLVNSNPNNINIGRNLLVDALDYAKVIDDGAGNPILANPGTNVARISNSLNGNYNRQTSKWVEDGSYIRLKNISLNYDFGSKILKDLKIIQGFRVGVGVQNIATFTKYSGYDPEVGSYVGNASYQGSQPIGFDYGRYPITPMYSFNLGLNF
ncbi:SusC/RagA family TonB-linked outer membrane protein [Flavobacterium sp. TMP13]|uniref:SusC/RagA family TonB-linked outer membrane protein n=1 Tax=Flavobacterium sp. TMP13 TaxID=3425950 RepID=UPI003D785647